MVSPPFPPPSIRKVISSNRRALRRYLGMVNYYHRFIPHCAKKLTPLNNLLTESNEGQNRLSPKSNFDLHWTEKANLAFTESKQILANATVLVHPNTSAPLNIRCDASDFMVGGVLLQCIHNVWQPQSLFSKKSAPAEPRYRAFDRELLAVYATIKHFGHNLEGREFFLNTNHKPLTYVMNSMTERSSLHLHSRIHDGYSICERRNKFCSRRFVATNCISYRVRCGNKL